MNTDIVLMHNTDVERREEDREMDFTDKAVFGQQTGETAAWAVECRQREMTIVGEEGKDVGNM